MKRLAITCGVLAALEIPARAEGLSASSISLPSGPGSIEGLGNSFTPNLATGTASYRIAIAVPPGALAFSPNLAIEYDSGYGDGELGQGWRLSGLPRIRRSLRDSLPRFDDTDDFEIVGLGATSELVPTTNDEYRPEFESGTFARIKRLPDRTWEARDKSGVTYVFGAQVETDTGRVTTWLLRESTDLFGHRIRYDWDTSSGYALLERIRYNDYGADIVNELTFNYAARPDVLSFFSAGIPQTLGQRLASIVIKHGGGLVRRYELGYEEGTRSRLATVDLVGRDGTSRMPRSTFTYTKSTVPTGTKIVAMTSPPGVSPADPNNELLDLDGDGLPDLLVTRAGAYRAYLNRDGTRWAAPISWSQSPSVELGQPGVELADVNGDGAADLLVKGSASLRYQPGVSESRFGSSIAFATVPNVTLEDPEVRLADMDGDRRADLIVTTASGIAVGYNTGTDWTTPSVVGVVDPAQPLMFSDGRTQLCDMNGDRVVDLCYLRSGSLRYWRGRGRGVFDAVRTATNVPTWANDARWSLHDIDGDGWPDFVRVGHDRVEYALAIAEGRYAPPQALTEVPQRTSTMTVRFADMNANGTTDIVWIDPPQGTTLAWRYLELFLAGRGGLLASIDNGLGQRTRIEYGAAALDAAAARDAGRPWTTRMNVPMTVVRTIEVSYGLGDPPSRIALAYRHGAWANAERTFAGFGGGVETRVGDGSTPTLLVDSTFDVGESDVTRRGLVTGIESRDAGGRVFERKTMTYTSRTLATGGGKQVHRTFKASERRTSVEGTTQPRTTLIEWEEDDFGNVVVERRWGEVVAGNKLAGNDEAITRRTFANDTSTWVIGRQATEELLDASGARIRAWRQYYDGPPYVGLALLQVTRGAITRREEWVGPGLDIYELGHAAAFDPDGHPLVRRDALGTEHVLTWDSSDHTTLTAETVRFANRAFTETVSADRAFGAPLRVVGFDGATTLVEYDAFGRVASIVRPGDTPALPTAKFSYLHASPLSRIVIEKRIVHGSATTERSETLVDGAGRTRGTFAKLAADRYTFSDVVWYDARGNVMRKLRPRFASAAEVVNPDVHPTATGITLGYDAMGRKREERDELGIVQTTTYGPFTTSIWDGGQTDPSSPYEHTPTVESRDGLDRVIEQRRALQSVPVAMRFTFDASGALTSRTDPEGHTTRFTYDGRGRRTRAVDPDAGDHRYTFDKLGNVLVHQTPTATQRFTYDGLGRLLTEDWNDDGRPEVVRTWDENPADATNTIYRGRLVRIVDPSGTTDFGYDARGNHTRTAMQIDGKTYRWGSEYDAQDRERVHELPDGSTIELTRDGRGQVTAYDNRLLVTYDADGLELSHTLGGVSEHYDYDAARRLVHTTAAASAVIQDLAWHYDHANNLTRVVDGRSGIDPAKSRTEEYAYDNLYRLTSASGAWGATTFAYSPSGNLVARDSADPTLRRSLAYAPARPHAAASNNAAAITYDASGRLVDDGGRTLEWDGKDHLTRVTTRDGAETTSVFDAGSQRRIRRELQGTRTSATIFLDDWAEVIDGKLVRYLVHRGRRLVRFADASAPATATSASRSQRSTGSCSAAGSAGLVITGLLILGLVFRRRLMWCLLVVLVCSTCSSQVRSQERRGLLAPSDDDQLMFYDLTGSVTEITNARGVPVESFATMPYGAPRIDGTSATRRYANSPRDVVLLDQMGRRAYAPDLMRWTSPDPVLLDPSYVVKGIGQENSYGYARSNPMQHVDPGGGSACVVRPTGISCQEGVQLEFMKTVMDYREDKLSTAGFVGKFVWLWFEDKIAGALDTVALPWVNAMFKIEYFNRTHDTDLLLPLGMDLLTVTMMASAVKFSPAYLEREAFAAHLTLDAEFAMQKGYQPANIVGGFSRTQNRFIAGTNVGRGMGCAEVACWEALGKPSDIKFTIPTRRGQPFHVCESCELKFGRDAFPPGATFKSDLAK